MANNSSITPGHSAGALEGVAGWAAGIIALGLTVGGWHLASVHAADQVRRAFEGEANKMMGAIQQRLTLYESSLRGARALILANEGRVTRAQWRSYVEGLDLNSRFPGILGIGYSVRLTPAELEPHMLAVRSEGHTDYHVWPEQPRDQYHAIVYLEPFEGRNRRALGYDMFTEPTRGAAMAQARDSGLLAASGKVTLVQETAEGVQAGFLMYLPVFRDGLPTATVSQRRAALAGFTYSPFRMRDLMDGILGDRDNRIAYEIRDAGAADRPVMYRSREGIESIARDALYVSDRRLELGGRQWEVRSYAQPAFASTLDRLVPLIVLAGGGVISGLLLAIGHWLTRDRLRTHARAEAMARDLARGEEHFRITMEACHTAIATANAAGIVTYVNPAFERLFGYPASECRGRAVQYFFPERLLAAHAGGDFRAFLDAAASRTAGGMREITVRRRDGTEVPVEFSLTEWSTPEGQFVTGFIRDVSERRAIERALDEAHERERQTAAQEFRYLFEHNPIPMWIYDASDLRFLEVNESAIGKYGYARDEFLRMSILDIRPPEETDRLMRTRGTGGRDSLRASGPWTHRLRDGTLVEVEVHAYRLAWAGRDAVLVVTHDVTELRRAQGELLRHNERLEHRVAERTRELEDANRGLEAFSYSVSHDLRSPLATIRGFADVLGEDGNLDAEGQGALQRIVEATDRMDRLVTGLLALGQVNMRGLERQSLDLTELARSIADDLDRGRQRPGTQVHIEGGLSIDADPALMRAALENLLGNAWKFTRGRTNALIEVGAIRDGADTIHFVRDNGVGFDPAAADRLFQPFQRLHAGSTFEGTGVGLSTVARIVERHGGRIWAEAQRGEGACFYFTVAGAGSRVRAIRPILRSA